MIGRPSGLLLAIAILVSAPDAGAQVSCVLGSQYIDVFMSGGGANVSGAPTPELLKTAGTPVDMGVFCEGTGQFPPPGISGATYSWSTGETTQRIRVVSPAPGQAAPYSVTVNSPAGRTTLSTTLRGAVPGAPNCTVLRTAPEPMVPGTVFTLTASCAPEATTYAWDAREFLGYMTILSSRSQKSVDIRFNGAQAGQVMPIYLAPGSPSGQGAFASMLVTASYPAASLPITAPQIAGGGAHSCALTSAGGVKCWGDDTSGQLGDYRGAAFYTTTPANVIGSGTEARSIAAGLTHTCQLDAAGGVTCWGGNFYGQLGDGSKDSSYIKIGVLGLASGVAAIAANASGDHTCAVRSGGAAKCWGRNDYGQLGNNSSIHSPVPVDVVGLASGVTRMAAGGAHTCALVNGAVSCWGRNSEGELGDGTTSNRSAPVAVAGLASGVDAIAAGFSHTCALMTAGTVKCWGWNQEGEVGNGSSQTMLLVPADVSGLSNVLAISAGGNHTCALVSGGTLKCWGRNTEGQLGDGSFTNRGIPVAVSGTPSGMVSVAGGGFHTCAIIAGGGALCWGLNGSARLGDGTIASRTTPQLVLGALGSGYLDVTLEDTFQPPADRVPVFPVVATGTLSSVTANIRFRTQDVGTLGSVYVFALAPANIVKGGQAAKEAHIGPLAKGAPKDVPVQCVLAQLNASGQLQAVSASSLRSYVSGVLSAQGQAVTILDGIPIAQIGGANYYVGYGSDASSMFANGTNRSVVGAGDPGAVACQPQAPQTGWWWNPIEGGRGFSIEAQGNHLFFAAFHYDVSGRATWNVSPGITSLDGSYFSSDLYAVSGGQALGGAYRPATAVKAGAITLLFSDASHGTMIWPGGVVPIERQPFVPGSLVAAPLANQPQSGWWWNPAESGRGFFIEWQGGKADLAGYMYDDAGNPVWYIAVYDTPNPRAFSGNWWSYVNGQSMGGAYKPPTQTSNTVAPVTITFSGPDTALMTLPNGRTTTLVRQRF